MLRSFLRDSLVYGLATVLSRGVALLAVPILTRLLTPADYGAIDIIAIVTSFAGVIVSLEIVQAVARFYPDTRDPDERVRIASTSLLFAGAGYGLLLVAGEVFAPELARLLLGDPAREDVVRVALLAIFANGIFYVIQSQLRWRLMARRYALASVIYAVVSIGSGVALIVAGAGVAGVFLGQVVGAGLAGAASFAAVGGDFQLRLDRRLLGEMLRFSAPLVPSSLSVYVILYVDRIAINALLGLTAVGLFGIGYRVASLITLPNVGVQGALSPLIYTHFRDEQTPVDIARIFRLYAAGLLLGWLVLGLFTREILAIVTTPTYAASAAVVPILTPALALAGLYVFAPGLSIHKRTGWIAVVNVGGAVLNTVLNLSLVPAFGIVGAATATLGCSVVMFGTTMWLSQRAYPVPHAWWPLVGASLTVAGVLAIGWQLEPGSLTLVLKAALVVVAGGAILAARLVSTDELRRVPAIVQGVLRRASLAGG